MYLTCPLVALCVISIARLPGAVGAYVPGKAFDRFVTIWLENEDALAVEANSDYKNLSAQGILLTNYYALTHPSQPNYIASVSGDYFGLDNDNTVQVPENVSTIVDLFETKGIAWKEYMESIPSPGYTGLTATDGSGHIAYARKHNPLVSFASVSNNRSRLQNIVSFDQFENDVKSQSLPQWMHLSPNMSNDGHDTGLNYGVAWSKRFLIPLLQNNYFTKRTLIHLTLDETATYEKPNMVASLLLGDIPEDLKGTTDDTFYTHYSALATIENNWELPNLGRYDVGANVFQIAANMTGYKNQNIVDTARIHLNQSYPGYLSSSQTISVPTPNANLPGAGNQGILGSIANIWVNRTGCGSFSTPYNGSGLVFDAISQPQYETVQVSSEVSGTSTACTAGLRSTSTMTADGSRKYSKVILHRIILSMTAFLWAFT